jgi:competence protein ComEC
MSILVLQNVELAENSNLTTGEVLIKAMVEDIQKKRNSDYIILDAGEKHILLKMTDTLAILPGDTLIIRGKLKMPPSPRNPGQFDYGAYLRSQNISAVVDREFSILEIIEGNTGLQR